MLVDQLVHCSHVCFVYSRTDLIYSDVALILTCANKLAMLFARLAPPLLPIQLARKWALLLSLSLPTIDSLLAFSYTPRVFFLSFFGSLAQPPPCILTWQNPCILCALSFYDVFLR